MTQEPHKDSQATRRGVLASVGLVGLAGAITACSSSASSSSTPASAATTSAPTGAGTAAASSGASASAPASSAGALTATSKIPVGSGTIFDAKKVVVTQPASGEFKAFSAVCTHMGCTVSQVSNGTIDCPCHGSQYSIKTGAVVAGPAPSPLPAVQIKVSGDSIFLE